jgi:hypothetical protein
MQLKLIEASGDGKPTVLATPRFAVEVIKSETDDESIKGSPTYTAVEEAIARAKGVYESRLLRIALDSDCVFTAYYADGTVYESDVLKELFLKGDVLLSQSYAKGGSGVRDGEDTDNAMYYSQVAKSMSLETKASGEDALAILDEVKKHGVYTAFSANFETGELVYESPKYNFEINKETGELNIIGKAYTIEENMVHVIEEWLMGFGVSFPAFKDLVLTLKTKVETLSPAIQTHSDVIATMPGEVLWENSNPAEDFEETTIEMDLSAFKRFRVVYIANKTNNIHDEKTISTKGVQYRLSSCYVGTSNTDYYRGITFSDTSIAIDKGVGSTDPDNSVLIPVKIIGYKY